MKPINILRMRTPPVAGGGPVNTTDGIFDLFPPTSALFSLSNLASGLTLNKADGDVFTATIPNGGGLVGDKVAFCGKAVPAGSPWSAIMGMWGGHIKAGGNNFTRIGLGLLENSTGKSLTICLNPSGAFGAILDVISMTSLTGGYSSLGSANVYAGRFPIHYKIDWNGTTYTFSYSLDFGDSWEQLGTALASSYFTADRIGICMPTYYNASDSPDSRAQVFYYSDPDHIP